jgi:hypothetical protein
VLLDARARRNDDLKLMLSAFWYVMLVAIHFFDHWTVVEKGVRAISKDYIQALSDISTQSILIMDKAH